MAVVGRKNPLLSVEDDWGYAEVYQHIKEFWILVALVFLAVKMGWMCLILSLATRR